MTAICKLAVGQGDFGDVTKLSLLSGGGWVMAVVRRFLAKIGTNNEN